MLGLYLLPVVAIVLLFLPRRYAPAAFLGGVLYLGMGVGFDIGGFNLYSLRILILFGFTRVMSRSEWARPFGRGTDICMLLFVILSLTASVFHDPVERALVANGGIAFDAFGTYYLFRCWIKSWDDVLDYMRGILVILIPMAVFMIAEFATGTNIFHYINGAALHAIVRNNHFRACGPFRSVILAGTAGAIGLPLAIALWRRGESRLFRWLALSATVLIPLTTTSSGPLLTFVFAITGLVVWMRRESLPTLLRLSAVMIVLLQLVMKGPVWSLMAKIDLTGGSNGWYRARLISAAFEHFGEWWLGGTDYTRDWMPTGISWSPNHCDICDHYVWMGVMGGLPVLIMFVIILLSCYRNLTAMYRLCSDELPNQRFEIWCLGTILFAHTMTFFSVAYYDAPMVAMLYALLGVIVSARLSLISESQKEESEIWVSPSEESEPVANLAAHTQAGV